MARLTAEGEAVDYSRRLTVAQEQLAEYAAQKEEDAAGYLQQAQSLQMLLASLLASSEDGPAKTQLQAASNGLCQKLAEEAGEAKSFAAQQKADVERAKRSSSQVMFWLVIADVSCGLSQYKFQRHNPMVSTLFEMHPISKRQSVAG